MGTQGEQGEQGDAETSMPTTANPYALGESILSPPGVTVSKITHYLPLWVTVTKIPTMGD